MTYTKRLYEITVTIWDSKSCSGREVFKAVARGLVNAVVVKESIKQVFPEDLEVESGNETIKRSMKIEISPMFQHDIKEFIEKSEFE